MLISINERGIFNINVYIEMKTEFKFLVYFITFLTPGKRVRTHIQEHPYGAHIFTPSLFFMNRAWKTAHSHFYAHFVRTQRLYMRPLVIAAVTLTGRSNPCLIGY